MIVFNAGLLDGFEPNTLSDAIARRGLPQALWEALLATVPHTEQVVLEQLCWGT